MNVVDFVKCKSANKKLSMVTCYDYWSAQLLNESKIDAILVGDSLAMVMHGHKTTLPASVDIMRLHTESVVRGAPDKLIVADLPFLSYRSDLANNIKAVQQLMSTGASAVKLEGGVENLSIVKHLVDSGVPVMGHLGLTPQSIHQLGGFRVQGREESAAEKIVSGAKMLEEAGCFSIVLECVPTDLAQRISKDLQIPTIGIGAGPHTDGQILVLQDLLGLNGSFRPKFLRQYLSGGELITAAINKYDQDVKNSNYPSLEESYL